MSTNFYATAVIGLKVNAKYLKHELVIPAYEHNWPQTMSYDPNTGKKLWANKTEHVEIDGFKTVFLPMDDNIAFICILETPAIGAYGDGDAPATVLPANLDQLKSDLKMALKKANLGFLWKEKSFGIYPVLNWG